MRKTKSAAVMLAAAAATGAVLVVPALGWVPAITLGAKSEGSISEADRYQAANVVRAWRMNGEYSECMTDRGYDVPWQSTITLAPGLDDDPALVKVSKEIRITEGDEEAVWSTRGFLDAADDCLLISQERRGPGAYESIDDWPAILAEARKHGWSPDDPFALDQG